MHNNYICFTNFPKINELLCVFATIHVPEKVNTSYYNLIIKKCRQLIFENSEVLASPNLDQIYGIYIIVKESFYESGELQTYLSKHNLKAGAPSAVSKFIYEDCSMYTIIAKLAPKWNLVSNYFVRGRDFLTNTDIKDCVRLSLCINDKGETSMIFEISRIRIPTMSLDKLDLPDHYYKELKQNKAITFKLCNSRTIRVFPSLKRGNILSINLKINESWSLHNYKQFQRHWKNTYGYRLPETDKDIFYLEVSFFDGSPVFTYPSVCVRPYEPTFVQRVEPGPVVAGFIADLMRCMPNILGDNYPVPSHINQPKPLLFSGKENVQHSNICAIDLNNIPDSQSSAFVYLPTQKQTNNEHDSKSKLSQLLSQLNKPENKSPIYLTQKTTFTQGISQTPQTAEEKLLDDDISYKKPKPLGTKLSLISQEIQNQAQFLTEKLAERSDMTPKKVPNFSKPPKSATEIKQAENTTKKIAPVFKSKFPKIKNIKYIPESVIKPVEKELKSTKTDDDDFIMPDKKLKSTMSNKVKEKENYNEESTKHNNNNVEKKRVNADKTSEATVAKKPREKVVTEVNNMKELVNNGTINKLNVQSLKKWLKDRNIHFAAKEKKSNLVEKVINNLSKN